MNSSRHELVAALLELTQMHPEWRYGQLVANVAAWAGGDEPGNVWDVSDADMLKAAREHLRTRALHAT